MQRHASEEFIIDQTSRPDAPLVLQRWNRKGKTWHTFGTVKSRIAAEEGIEQQLQAVRLNGDCSVTVRNFRAVVQLAEDKVISIRDVQSAANDLLQGVK